MNDKSIYSDRLVSITETAITFRRYYFPTGKRKIERFADIERIEVKAPTIWNGKWRIHGTGSFKSWYPCDMQRSKRDRIFFATLKNQWINIGFTVENADLVEGILSRMNLIRAWRIFKKQPEQGDTFGKGNRS